MYGFGLNELLISVIYAVIYFVAATFAIAAGVYLGNKWTKRGHLPRVLQFLDNKEK